MFGEVGASPGKEKCIGAEGRPNFFLPGTPRGAPQKELRVYVRWSCRPLVVQGELFGQEKNSVHWTLSGPVSNGLFGSMAVLESPCQYIYQSPRQDQCLSLVGLRHVGAQVIGLNVAPCFMTAGRY